MKKVFLLLLTAIALSSCVTRSYYVETGSIDYSQYTKEGFFMTEASSVSFDYEPVASVYTIIYSGEDKEWAKKNKSKENPFPSKWRRPTYAEGVDVIYKDAISKGANGIIGLKYQAVHTLKEGYLNYIYVEGMAIKKK